MIISDKKQREYDGPFAPRTEKQILKCPHIFSYAVIYSLYHIEIARMLWCVLHASKVKKNNLRCMQWFQRCTVLLAKSPASTNREKQKVIPLKTTVQLSGTHEQIMNFLGREIKAKPRSLLTLMHFILAKMSIVYLLLFAFTLKYSPFFPDVPPVFLLLHSSLMNWRRWTRLLEEKKPEAAAIAFPAPGFC